MQRRNFLSLGAAPALSALLASCGGSGDDFEDPVDTDDGIEEPGVDPDTLSSLPEPIEIDWAYLVEDVSTPIEALVMLGSNPANDILVNFYSLNGDFLGSAYTDHNGLAVSEIPAKRVVVAEAFTPDGRMLGMRFYADFEFRPSIEVNVLQTIVVDVLERIAGQENHYNVGFYVLHDYFQVPHNTNFFDLDHDHPLIDQRLVYEEWKSSSKSLENYIHLISSDIINHIDDSYYSNTRFNTLSKTKATLSSNSTEDIINDIGTMAIELIGVEFPLLSPLLQFGFNRFMGGVFPSGPDPLLEIQTQLQELQDSINGISNQIKIDKLDQELKDMNRLFDTFYNTRDAFQSLLSSVTKDGDFSQTRFKIYEKYIEELSTISLYSPRADLLTASRLFFGDSPYNNGVIDAVLQVISKKFHSESSEAEYKNYLAHFLSQQAMCHLFLALSYIIVGSKQIEKGETTEAQIKEKVNTVLEDFSKIFERVKKFDVPALPDRINIDVENKLVWVGACHPIHEMADLWPPSEEAKYTQVNYPYDIYKVQGKGRDDWKGPKIKDHMLRGSSCAQQNYCDTDYDLSQDAYDFTTWRAPHRDELRLSFVNAAKKSKDDIKVYAATQGFSGFSKRIGKKLNVFHNYNKKTFAVAAGEYRRAGGGVYGSKYIDYAYVDFNDYEVCKSRDARTAKNTGYNNGRFFDSVVMFPVGDISEKKLNEYVPWLHARSLLGRK